MSEQVTTALSVSEASALGGRVMDEVARAVVGKRGTLMLVLAAILAKGHVLLEDFPGLGKTLAARSFARALGLEFTRAQFTRKSSFDVTKPASPCPTVGSLSPTGVLPSSTRRRSLRAAPR